MKEQTVNNILEIGTVLISRKGFNNVGLQEILKEAAIPKGSFYYYFKSKEDFGIQVISHYSNKSLEILESFLNDQSELPKQRILNFFTSIKEVYRNKDFTEGCLLGNCALELSDLKSSFANNLALELDKWQTPIEKCIQEGQENGSIKNEKDPQVLAAFILNSWEGALLRMKPTKSAFPVEIFIDFVDEILT